MPTNTSTTVKTHFSETTFLIKKVVYQRGGIVYANSQLFLKLLLMWVFFILLKKPRNFMKIKPKWLVQPHIVCVQRYRIIRVGATLAFISFIGNTFPLTPIVLITLVKFITTKPLHPSTIPYYFNIPCPIFDRFRNGSVIDQSIISIVVCLC